MDEQREQEHEDQRPVAEATDELADAELEQAAGGSQNNLRTRQEFLLPYIEQDNVRDGTSNTILISE